MPDGKAYKPGDVVTAMSGKTIEIIQHHRRRRPPRPRRRSPLRQDPRLQLHLINAATLTGACVVALGMLNAGIFSNDDAAYEKFNAGLAHTGEHYWRLPCTADYRDLASSLASPTS